jgi:hypothetical protein
MLAGRKTSPRQVTRPMRKYPQIPRLAIVTSTNKKPRQESAGTQWWGPQRPPATMKIQAPSQAIRMAVMPTLSRNMWFSALAWISQFVRSYFLSGTARQRGAVVLSFRRHAAQAKKKSCGSVGWHSTQEAAPQEGGRR